MSTNKRASLHTAWDRVKTVPGLGRNVVVMAVLVVTGLVTVGVLLSKTQFTPPWEDRAVVWAEFESAPAVNPDATHAVTIAGVEVGKIADWQVTGRGTARLKLQLEPGHRIYDNARAVLRAVNPLNEMYVEINPGGPPGKPLPEDGVIPKGRTERPVQADEVLGHLDERTQAAMTSLLAESDAALARAPEQLPAGLNATADTLGRYRPVVEALRTRRAQISRLVSALAGISAAVGKNDERLARLADSTQQTLNALARNDGALRASLEQMPGLNVELRSALTSTQRLTGQLDPTLHGLSRASADLPATLERLRSTIRNAGRTVDAAAPVVQRARPVVADLRPFVRDADSTLDDALPVTRRLDRDTKVVVSYLTDLQAFVYNTSSVFGLEDGQGGFIRGHVVVTLPDGGALPDKEGYKPSPEESGVDRSPDSGSTLAPQGGNR